MEGDLRSKLPDELVDELLAGADSEEEIVGPGGLLSQLTKRLVERAMEVELGDLTRRSWRCTPAACRFVTCRRTCASSTGSRSRLG